MASSRIIAFFATNNKKDSTGFKKAKGHIEKLAKEFGLCSFSRQYDTFFLSICYQGDLDKLIEEKDDVLCKVVVGPLDSQKQSGYDAKIENMLLIRDRFAKISIYEGCIEVINDFAGTVPIYYSMDKHISLSNIEPVVILDSESSFDDVSIENIYGFLRYSHFIWDETLFKHIFTQEPDTFYQYKAKSKEIIKKYLGTIKTTDERVNMPVKSVAGQLYELNQLMVTESLKNSEKIILPLSAGYDSRMVLTAVATNKDLKEKLHCYTYGHRGTTEVESARELCRQYGVKWKQIILPCRFLEHKYLQQIGDIFGSSLHFHGMYQLEFWQQLKNPGITNNMHLTSGFMTGVPAGQHISRLGIESEDMYLTKAMNRFPQSRYWTDRELWDISALFKPFMLDKAEHQFRKPFDRFQGHVYQKSVLFDIWTRQRNFISYYPRTFEWVVPCLSPHMSPEYQNFFLSLSAKHLKDRWAVEMMLKLYCPEAAKVISNSNGLKALSSNYKNALVFISKILKRVYLVSLMPRRYRNLSDEFDLPALFHSKKDGLWPLFLLRSQGSQFFSQLFPDKIIEDIFTDAINGSVISYGKLVTLESIAYSLNLLEK